MKYSKGKETLFLSSGKVKEGRTGDVQFCHVLQRSQAWGQQNRKDKVADGPLQAQKEARSLVKRKNEQK